MTLICIPIFNSIVSVFLLFQAVNKLAEIANRKDFTPTDEPGKKKSAVAKLKKKEQEIRNLRHELSQEKEQTKKVVDKYKRHLEEAHSAVSEGDDKIRQMQMAMDAKDSKIEELLYKLAMNNRSLNPNDEAGASVTVNGFGDSLAVSIVSQDSCVNVMGEAMPGEKNNCTFYFYDL